MASRIAGDAHTSDQQAHPAEPRNLQSVTLELQRKLEEASEALDELKTQQAICSAGLLRFESDLDAVRALGREMKELIDHPAQEPLQQSSMVTALQAAVEKTRNTVVGQVEHVRERAISAFHRMKGERSGEEVADRKSFNDKH